MSEQPQNPGSDSVDEVSDEDRDLIHAAEVAERRARRYRRLRQFFVASVVLHLVFFLALALSEDLRHAIFGDDSTTVDTFDPRAAEVERAMRNLLEIQERRLRRSAEQLAAIRTELNRIQQTKLERLREQDAIRKVQVEQGIYPTPENPDPSITYAPRVDIDPPAVDLTGPDMARMDELEPLDLVVELYRWHQPLEEQAGRLYERFRALQLAEHPEEPIPVSQTLEITRLVMPDRKEIDLSRLNMDVRTRADGRYETYREHLEAFREELTDTFLEAENMVATARRWLELVRAIESDPGTLFGEQYDTTPPPVAYYGHYLDPRQLQRTSLQRVINPPASLGRKIASEDTADKAAQWISVDRWYYVGPFGHPGRERRLDQLDRTYPPEAGVHRNERPDLDATYQGRDGRRLQWKYRRVDTTFLENGIRFEPFVVDNMEYAIWYFYTEVYSDEDREVLVSFASDDFGVCWVNGRRVWQSPPDMQPWVPFTAHNFRVVPLRKGTNRVLFKLENAPGTTAFSMLLMTYEDKDLTRGIPTGP